MKRLEGKVALLFGASPNNGGTTAHFMAREGARIWLCDNQAQMGAETQAFLQSRGYEAVASEVDGSDESAVRDAVAAAVGRFGRLDIVVNMAGRQIRFDVVDIPLDDWNRQLASYLTSAMLTTKHAARAMTGGGSIIHIASDAAHQGEPGNSGYSAAKAGVVNFARAAAAELGERGIRVNTISPTYIEHNLWKYGIETTRTAFRATADDFLRGIPLKRYCRASDVAHAAVFLASDESSFITGCDIPLDGGARARYWAWVPGNVSGVTAEDYKQAAHPQQYGEPLDD